jgi:hypothetical protein
MLNRSAARGLTPARAAQGLGLTPENVAHVSIGEHGLLDRLSRMSAGHRHAGGARGKDANARDIRESNSGNVKPRSCGFHRAGRHNGTGS